MKPLFQMRKLRLLGGMTFDDVGLQTGLDQSYLSRLECGLYQPAYQAAKKIADVLDCFPTDLWPDLEPGQGKVANA